MTHYRNHLGDDVWGACLTHDSRRERAYTVARVDTGRMSTPSPPTLRHDARPSVSDSTLIRRIRSFANGEFFAFQVTFCS
jgi:hypothetical protein